MAGMAEIRLEQVCKVYPDGTQAVDQVDLEVADGEFVVLVGPSGCGKSTTLRMVAGLEEISSGTISIAGEVVNSVPPKDRDIAMVFQSYALYPHMNVRRNLAFGLERRRRHGGPLSRFSAAAREESATIARRIEETAKLLGIEALLERKPGQLSGGQRQRVALGRAIVRDPAAFLFDEPLSNLDAKLRLEMRAEIKALHRRLGATTLYVTHDQEEAMTLGDRLVVMKDGVVQQIATPAEVYARPANRFVASFVGSPPMNFFEDIDSDAVLGIRPEALQPLPADDPAALLRGELELIEELGDRTDLYFRVSGREPIYICRCGTHPELREGQPLGFRYSPAAVHRFAKGRNGRRLADAAASPVGD